MQASKPHPIPSLPSSPHRESYERFYGNLKNEIKKWLTELLVQLKNEQKIAFDPAVNIPQIPPYRYPEEEDESCRLQGKNLEKGITIRVSLGGGSDHWDWELGQFPQMTSRGSFIHNGKERLLAAQLSNSPGIFFSWEEKSEKQGSVLYKKRYAVAKFRPEAGRHLEFRKEVEPDDARIQVYFSQDRSASLENFLEALGFSEDEQKRIFQRTDAKADSNKDIALIARFLGLGKELKEELKAVGDENRGVIYKKIQNRFYSSLLGELGRRQVNRRIAKIDPTYMEGSEGITKEDISGILKTFTAFINGKVQEDDSWDLGNLRVRLVGDYLKEGLNHWFHWMNLKIRKRIEEEIRKGNRIDRNTMKEILLDANIDTASSTLFGRLINEWIFRSPMSQIIPEGQNNLLDAASLTRKITFSGWGAFQSARKESRGIFTGATTGGSARLIRRNPKRSGPLCHWRLGQGSTNSGSLRQPVTKSSVIMGKSVSNLK